MESLFEGLSFVSVTAEDLYALSQSMKSQHRDSEIESWPPPKKTACSIRLSLMNDLIQSKAVSDSYLILNSQSTEGAVSKQVWHAAAITRLRFKQSVPSFDLKEFNESLEKSD